MSLSAKQQQVVSGLSGADVRLSCHKVILLLLNGLQNGLQRLILRIPSQQLIMLCHRAVRAECGHSRLHARMHTHTHTRIDLVL